MIFINKSLKTDFLTWTALRLSVPKELRSCELLPEVDSLNFKHNIQFDVYRAKCKHFYKLLITAMAKLPNMSKKLISDSDTLEVIYSLPQTVASETYNLVLPMQSAQLYIVHKCKTFQDRFVVEWINAPFVTLQKKSCITSFSNAPVRKSFGKDSLLGGLNLLKKT